MLSTQTSSIIDMLVACDSAFAQHTHVLLASVLQSNPHSLFRVSILVPTEFAFKQRLMQLKEYGNCELRFVAVPGSLVADFPTSGHVSSAK